MTKEFYPAEEEKGKRYFFDIGANIGTTSIYVKKELDSSLRVVAFECSRKNYDIMRVNCILNQVEDIEVECLGISNINKIWRCQYVPSNPGGTRLVSDKIPIKEVPTDMEDVQLIRFDDYIKSRNILPDEIKSIWIDVETHEPQVLDSMREVFVIKKVPILHEFTPSLYQSAGTFNLYESIITKHYDSFIDVNQWKKGIKKTLSVSAIREYAQKMLNSGTHQTDLFLF